VCVWCVCGVCVCGVCMCVWAGTDYECVFTLFGFRREQNQQTHTQSEHMAVSLSIETGTFELKVKENSREPLVSGRM